MWLILSNISDRKDKNDFQFNLWNVKIFFDLASLIILDKSSKEKVEKSLRNIPNVKVTDINHFSAFDIIKYKKIVFTETSVKELEKRFA